MKGAVEGSRENLEILKVHVCNDRYEVTTMEETPTTSTMIWTEESDTTTESTQSFTVTETVPEGKFFL